MHSLVRVYRIELGFSFLTNEGTLESMQQGPYTTYSTVMSKLNGYRALNLSDDELTQPEPESDGLSVRMRYIFGFKDIAQMNAWFINDLLALNSAGFVLAEYLVPASMVQYGSRQLQFHRECCSLDKMTNILDAIRNEHVTNPNYDDEVCEYF